LPGGLIITIDEEEKIEENGKLIKVIPAWKYLLKKKHPKNSKLPVLP